MLHSNQHNKNHLPRVIASVLFVDLENLTRGFDRLLKEAYSRFSSFPTAIRRQNLEIRHDYKCGNPDQENAKDIYMGQCMILDKESTTFKSKEDWSNKRVMETIIDEKRSNNDAKLCILKNYLLIQVIDARFQTFS